MKAIISTLIVSFLFVNNYFSQVTIGSTGNPSSNPLDCSNTTTFQDQAGSGNYTANYNGSITFCPDLQCAAATSDPGGSKVTAVFATDAGLTWDVNSSDTLYVYDGPDANAPLIGAYNSGTNPGGFTATASWQNTSGCLTFVFVTDGANEGAGWEANVNCGFVNQPFDLHLEAFVNGQGGNALDPLDSGFVNICFEDSILFVAKPLFPNSCETNGYGYNQNTENVTYAWETSSGLTFNNNDSIWFKPPTRSGFFLDLRVTDIFPQTERLIAKVRVSQLPSFAEAGPTQNPVCPGDSSILIGGVTQTDTAGVDIPGGTFEVGGSFAGLTNLPDGSGVQYTSPITISDFPAGSVVTNAQSLNKVCITIEHSYIGDLEIALQCPNGTQVPLINSYNPGFISGGTSGSGLFLGDPIDNTGGTPGTGWEYCFSSVYNTWGDYPTEYGNQNFVPATVHGNNGNSLNPNGVYLPESSFADFAGCPVNGQWTIIVQDNISSDDGYIFSWGLFFDASYFPDSYSYQNTIVEEGWAENPTILNGQGGDTLVYVKPTEAGTYNYTYKVTDDFGCNYDTTFDLTVLKNTTIGFIDTTICNQLYMVIPSAVANNNGVAWYSDDSLVQFTDTTLLLPGFQVPSPGEYTVNMIDIQCQDTASGTVHFPHPVEVFTSDTTVCIGAQALLVATSNYADTLYWSTGESTDSIIGQSGQTYEVTASNYCYSASDTATIFEKMCDVKAPNVLSFSSTSGNNSWYVDASGLKEFKCVILNRWGNVIYEFDDPKGSWNGKGLNGLNVAEGTYFYKLNAKTEGGEEIFKHGFIQVVR